MIYMDVDLEQWAKENHLEIKQRVCEWGCEKKLIPKAVQTKQSKGIIYECDCGYFTYVARPKDLEPWNKIV